MDYLIIAGIAVTRSVPAVSCDICICMLLLPMLPIKLAVG